ncbi:MAG: PhzF family phenazine biosynthesis protein [Gammaproteobacteria bacterium]
MKARIFQVDAFTDHAFAGNPAAVCPLDAWPADELLQAVAAENNLSETAFFVPAGEIFQLRWFTPVAEVPLCGHATLATAHVLYEHLACSQAALNFQTLSGRLTVTRSATGLCMDFPARKPQAVEAPKTLIAGLGKLPREVLADENYLAVYDSEEAVRGLAPDFAVLRSLDRFGVIVTAPGRDVDFISRCFFPRVGINEDPVTGSAHCELVPYWSTCLKRDQLAARQISKRGGAIACEIRGDRVLLSGKAVTFLIGEINVS